MATYDVTSHGSLSRDAAALYASDADAFDATVLEAEDLLDLTDTTFTGDEAKRAKLALAIQVSHLVAIDSDVLIYSMQVRGSVTNATKAGTPELIHPRAARIVQGLGRMQQSSFKTVRRVR